MASKKKGSDKFTGELNAILGQIEADAREREKTAKSPLKTRGRPKAKTPKSEWGLDVEVRKASPNASRSEDVVLGKNELSRIEEARRVYKDDIPLFADKCLDVLDRDNPAGAAIVPCTFTESQVYIHQTIEAIENYNLMVAQMKRDEGLDVPLSKLPIETVVLKARKVRASTYFRVRAFHKNEFTEGHYDMVMAHEKDVARNLAEMMQRFARGWVEEVPGLRQKILRASDDLIEWEHDSRTVVKTANSKSGGSSAGWTFHYEQLSELSRYPDGTTELASATTAASTYRELHIESTARGANELQNQWDNAMWLADVIAHIKSGTALPRSWNKKFRLFWAWWQEPGYTIQLPQIQREYVQRTIDAEEKELIEKYGLTLGQIQWRRDKIANECSQQRDLPPKEFFKQEYPSSPEEAFVTKGRAAFSREVIAELRDVSLAIIKKVENNEKYQEMPYFLGTLERDARAPGGFRMVPCRDIRSATLVLWKPPALNRAYVIGADSAEGLENSDDSVVTVFDRGFGVNLEEVACYMGKASGEETADIAFFLHQLYNNGFVVPERNNGSGMAMCLKLVRLGCIQVYHHKNPEEFSDREEPESFTVGFNTTPKTKKMMTEVAKAMIADRQLILRHPDGIEQMKNFQANEKGLMSAPSGKKDDYVMSVLLAVFGHQPDVAPPVWTGRRAPVSEDVEKLTPEQQLNLHYKKRVEAMLARERERNKRNEPYEQKAKLLIQWNDIIGD